MKRGVSIIEVDRLEVLIQAEASKANAELDRLIGKLNQVSTAMRGATGLKIGGATGISSTASSLSKYTSATSKAISGTHSLTAQIGKLAFAYYSLQNIVGGVAKSIKSSMDFTETINLFQTSFKKIGMEEAESMGMEWGSSSADAFAKGYIQRAQNFNDLLTASLGLDPNTMMNYQAVFAQMSNSMGLVTDSAMNISETFTMLGNDIASLWNIDTKVAMQKLQSGLAGQIRPLRQLGIDISQTSLQYTAMKYGIDDSVISMSQAAKVQLRWLSVMDQAEVAFGDMAKTIDSPANQVRILSQQWDLLTRSIGNVFMPAVQRILPYINAVVMALRNMINTLATAMGYELPDYTDSNIYTDVTGDIEGMTDATEDAIDANEKLKKSMYGGDELNILSDSSSSASGAIDSGSGYGTLDDAIQEKTDSYMKKFNDELEKMKTNSKDISDKITKFYNEVIAPMMGATVDETVIAFFDAFDSLLVTLQTFSSKFDSGDSKTIGEFFETMSNLTLGGITEWFTGLATALDSLTAFINDPSIETFGTVLESVFGAFLKAPGTPGVGWLTERILEVLGIDLETWFDENIKPWIDPSNWPSLIGDTVNDTITAIITLTLVIGTTWEDLKTKWNELLSNFKDKVVSITVNLPQTAIGLFLEWEKLTALLVGKAIDWTINFPQTAEKLFEKWALLTVKLVGKEVEFVVKIIQKWIDLESDYLALATMFVGKTVKFLVKIPQIWDDLKPLFDVLYDKFKGKNVNFKVSIPQVWNDLKARYDELKKYFVGKVVNFSVNLITSLGDIKKFVKSLIDAINTEIIAKLSIKIAGFEISAPKIPYPPGYENGGYPAPGQLFIANEPGNPELIGNMGGKTAVANGGQIEAGIEEAAFRGYIRAIAITSGQSNNSGTTQLNLVVDSEVLASAVAKGNSSRDRRINPTMQFV